MDALYSRQLIECHSTALWLNFITRNLCGAFQLSGVVGSYSSQGTDVSLKSE